MRLALALALALVLSPPGESEAQEKLHVVTTSYDLRSLVEAVGGERVSVESLSVPEQDPHVVELKPAQLARLQGAALLVRIGLDHEPWLSRIRIAEGLRVLDASRGVPLLQTETPRLRVERRAHAHAFGNTHYWLDPQNALPITASILEALVKLSPADRERFAANRKSFLSRLGNGIERWQAALAPFRGMRVVVMHDSWVYFAERFGLSIVAAAEPVPGVPPSPAELAALYRSMREAGVTVLIAEPHSNPELVRQIEDKGGARAVMLLPSGRDYIGLFDEDVGRLVSAMKRGPRPR